MQHVKWKKQRKEEGQVEDGGTRLVTEKKSQAVVRGYRLWRKTIPEAKKRKKEDSEEEKEGEGLKIVLQNCHICNYSIVYFIVILTIIKLFILRFSLSGFSCDTSTTPYTFINFTSSNFFTVQRKTATILAHTSPYFPTTSSQRDTNGSFLTPPMLTTIIANTAEFPKALSASSLHKPPVCNN